MLLVGNGRMITHDNGAPFWQDGCVAVEDGLIVAVGETAALRAAYAGAEFYDARRRLIMPGLINTHTHIYSAFARGMSLPQARPNRNFLDILNNLWWRLDKALNERDIRYSAFSTALESIRCGVTTVFDHHASPNYVSGSLSAIAESLAETGLRATLCYEVSDRDGAAVTEAGINENISFMDHAAQNGGDMLQGMFGLHASFTLSEKTLEKCCIAMDGRPAGFHIHMAEDAADVADSVGKYGLRVAERLYQAGILGQKTLAAHGVHLQEAELDILRKTATMVIHNPESNMGNAVGCAAALTMLQKGILLGLGTDAYTQDMFESLKVANIIHKHQQHDPSVGFNESLNMLFNNNAAICSRFFSKPLGILAAGAAADIIVVDYQPPTPLDQNTLAGHIMFGLSGRAVDSVIINGRFVMKERQIQTVDEAAILAQAREQAADLWRRI